MKVIGFSLNALFLIGALEKSIRMAFQWWPVSADVIKLFGRGNWPIALKCPQHRAADAEKRDRLIEKSGGSLFEPVRRRELMAASDRTYVLQLPNAGV